MYVCVLCITISGVIFPWRKPKYYILTYHGWRPRGPGVSASRYFILSIRHQYPESLDRVKWKFTEFVVYVRYTTKYGSLTRRSKLERSSPSGRLLLLAVVHLSTGSVCVRMHDAWYVRWWWRVYPITWNMHICKCNIRLFYPFGFLGGSSSRW